MSQEKLTRSALLSTDALTNQLFPLPKQVSGKEYSDNADKNTFGIPDPQQTLAWFGDGTTTDGFDYPGSGQVDAMANSGDALFDPVIKNRATLVFSTTFDDRILYETPLGGRGTWAKPTEIDLPGPKIDQGVHDVDALELWGPTDANRFSVYGDFRVAVWDYNSFTNTSTPLFYTPEIAKAIGLDDKFVPFLNVDAMMTSGERIMFSIDPIEGAGLDGGEIWVWDRNSGAPAQFLKHGGHLWDTAFNVRRTFGTATENINALEAINYSGPIIDIEPFEPTDIITTPIAVDSLA